MTQDNCLSIVLDTLLPGDGATWPAAGTHGLAERARALAALAPDGPEAVDRILAALPSDFDHLPQTKREAYLSTLEIANPEDFSALVTAAYNAYYTDPKVREIIELLTGYPNRPPQPLGYDLEPFDESLLDPVKARGPIWRPVPDA